MRVRSLSTLLQLSLAACGLAAASPLLASSIPYGNAGTVAPTVTTYASNSDGVGLKLYYWGSSAAFLDAIQVYDVNTGYLSRAVLPNDTSSVGQQATVGKSGIHQGDQLVFVIDSPLGVYSSDPNYLDADGVNHVYITPYAGGVMNGVSIPAGLFLGFEDKPKGNSDFDYNDLEVVVTGVSTTPEPSSLLLLGTGLLGVAGAARRRLA